MITLNKINQRGLAYIAMAIEDIVTGEYVESVKGHGMYLKNTWLSPETCYWLGKLCEETSLSLTSKETRDRLQAGTNVGLE